MAVLMYGSAWSESELRKLFIYPEDGSRRYILNVREDLPHYKSSYPRSQKPLAFDSMITNEPLEPGM
jgi:hypothetical protein